MNKQETLELMRENKQAGIDFDTFVAELGWVDWMNEYVTTPETEFLTDEEIEKINSVLKEMWELA